MCLRHRKLVPSLHYHQPNQSIDFEETPFYVNTTLKEWEVDAGGKRRAAVSSFGYSGTNAHLVVEEWETPRLMVGAGQPRLIVLSAKTEEQLDQIAARLSAHLDAADHADPDSLSDLAYTLHTGRLAMEERLAFVAESLSRVSESLSAFIRKTEGPVPLFRGRIDEFERAEPLSAQDVGENNLEGLAALWVGGRSLDGRLLYPEPARRISLPTYPFARERYWVEAVAPDVSGTKRLHPMVHENTSRLDALCFQSHFTGREFFLADHRVKGEVILPGVAYLETARAAVQHAAGRTEYPCFSHVVWARPLVVEDGAKDVHIGLFPLDDDRVQFEIQSGDERWVHSQGVVEFSAVADRPEPLDPRNLRAACPKTLSAEACYEAFEAAGIDYGPGYRGLEEVHVGEEFLLARISLPISAAATDRDYLLHPSIMDTAVQGSIGFALAGMDSG
ncbi:MAG: polyketide synthase dehydratase domain-containing protein, partial [Verrucomicrobiota bacterium]